MNHFAFILVVRLGPSGEAACRHEFQVGYGDRAEAERARDRVRAAGAALAGGADALVDAYLLGLCAGRMADGSRVYDRVGGAA